MTPIERVKLLQTMTAKHDLPGRKWEHSTFKRDHHRKIAAAKGFDSSHPVGTSFEEMLREGLAHRKMTDFVDSKYPGGR